MSATTTKKHTCSCGRSFANEQILRYHERVSNHAPAEVAAEVAAPAPEAAAAEAPKTEVPATVEASTAVAPVLAPASTPEVEASPLDELAAVVAVVAETQAPNAPVIVTNEMPNVRAGMLMSAEPVTLPERLSVATDASSAEDAYLAAIEILRSKRAEQESYDFELTNGSAVGEFVEFAEDFAAEAARVSKRAAAAGIAATYQILTKVVMLLVVLLLTGGMFGAGVGLVDLASGSSAPTHSSPAPWTTVARI